MIAAAGIAAYSNTMQVPFLFDDVGRIQEEPSIRTLWPPSVAMSNSNRPFVQYSFAMNYAVHGYEVLGYHVVNLGIHVVAALLLFGFTNRTLNRCGKSCSDVAGLLAFSVALIWVVHPLNTQAVTYTIQRLESMMGLAYIATLYFFVRSQDSSRRWPWLLCSMVACSIGMGCKEVMVSAPLIVLWYDRAFLANSWREIIAKRAAFYMLLAATWGVLAWSMLHYRLDYTSGSLLQVEGLTPWTYLLSQSTVLVHYLSLSFWPNGQSVYPAWPIAQSILEVWPQLIVIVAMLIATFWAIARQPRWGFLGGCFFLVLAPTSSVIPIQDLAFEHRMYLPLAALVGFVLLAAYFGLSQIGLSKQATIGLHLGIVIAIGTALGVTSFERNKVYVSEISVWKDTLVKSPKNVKVWVGLGGVFAKEKRYDDAREHFVQALKIAPNDSKANANFAGMLIELREYDLAGQHLERAFQSNPLDLDAITNMGHLQTRLGNFDEAAKYFEKAVDGFPNDEELRSCLVASYIRSGKISEAELCSQSNLDRRPNSAKANVDYASTLIAHGRNEQAIAYCERAIVLDTGLSTAYATLAVIVSDPAKAIELIARAIAIEPMSFDYNRTMGDMLLETKPMDSVKHYEIAIQSDPDSVEVLLKIGAAWHACGHPENGIPYLERVTQLVPEWVEARESLKAIKQSAGRP
jgi:protein O-mannosyl-transferase